MAGMDVEELAPPSPSPPPLHVIRVNAVSRTKNIRAIDLMTYLHKTFLHNKNEAEISH
jgi:hypothetical protein